MNDAQFRASVEREALAAGQPPDVARYLAAQVGKDTGKPRSAQAARFNATALTRPPRDRSGRIDALCGMYGAQALAREFKAAQGSLRAFVAMLESAAGGRATITPAGVENVRVALFAAQRGAA